ncbi:MAG: 2-isopropylmalate synthase [Oscillospiraceae bacterium]|jgi:2-isopropylmalate synthase|nr:2-isopropylmalate synthase [Oscillospiraceae bacterium]
MRKIKVFDTTLRDGEQSPGCSMNLSEKLQIAKQLDALGVDIIEAGFAIASPEDFKSVEAIARTVKSCQVASLARCTQGDIDAAWNAVKDAKYPRIHIFLAASDIHMEYKLKMTREQVLESIAKHVSYAKALCADLEFSCEDASRSDRDFLVKCCGTAIEAGATVINIPDTVGYSTPQEMFELIRYLREYTPGIENVDISAHCHDDLGLAVANSLACVRAGASQVECTINGIGERAGNASLEELVMALHTRREYYQAETRVNTRQIYRTSKLLSSVTGVPVAPSKAIVGANAFAHESGIHQHGVLANALTYEILRPADVGIPQNAMVLGKHSGKHALRDRLAQLGYEVTKEELDAIFVRFKALADKKKNLTDSDIEALALASSHSGSATYELLGHVVSAGTGITNLACVKIRRDDGVAEEAAIGSGPIDASFKAVDKITGLAVSLESFSLNAVTDGEDAMGEAVVKLRCGGGLYTGCGLSTDVIESAIRAYINGINKAVGAKY